jgi:hypothetical protein
VVSAAIPEMLATHIGVKPGAGIVVRAVMPDGPAAKAGVAVYDVITQIGGHVIGSSEALTEQVVAHKPGDTLHLNLIHEGKATHAEITLGVRPTDLAESAPLTLDQLNLDGIPQDLADRVRGMIHQNLGGLEMKLDPNGVQQDAPEINDVMREMKQRMEQAMQRLDLPGIPQRSGIDVQQGATIRMLDGDGSIELKSNKGGKEVTIRDKNNKILWSGPWDTAQDKAAAPDEIRQRVERLNLDTQVNGNGLHLQIRPAPAPDE